MNFTFFVLQIKSLQCCESFLKTKIKRMRKYQNQGSWKRGRLHSVGKWLGKSNFCWQRSCRKEVILSHDIRSYANDSVPSCGLKRITQNYNFLAFSYREKKYCIPLLPALIIETYSLITGNATSGNWIQADSTKNLNPATGWTCHCMSYRGTA